LTTQGKRLIADPVIAWLLEPSEPSLQFRTLRELLDVPPDDPKVVASRQSIPGSQAVVRLLEKMHPEGYWLQTNPRTGRTVGEGVEYGSFATTHFYLAMGFTPLEELPHIWDENNPCLILIKRL